MYITLPSAPRRAGGLRGSARVASRSCALRCRFQASYGDSPRLSPTINSEEIKVARGVKFEGYVEIQGFV